jgi:hypothetical protein
MLYKFSLAGSVNVAMVKKTIASETPPWFAIYSLEQYIGRAHNLLSALVGGKKHPGCWPKIFV